MKTQFQLLLVLLTSAQLIAADFRAYYTRLDYEDGISGKHADVVVRFDENQRFVFSRESSYLPYWQTKKGKWYVDEIYDVLFVNSTKKLGIFCWKGFDVKVVDGIVNGVAKLVGVIAATLRHTQTGLFQNYALTMVFGTVVMGAIFILN